MPHPSARAEEDMKILLDKSVNERLRHHLPEYTVHTARYMGWSRHTNGELLNEAEQAGYRALLTSDLSMKHTQNLDKWNIEVIDVEQQRPLSDESPLVRSGLRGSDDLRRAIGQGQSNGSHAVQGTDGDYATTL